MAIPNRLFRFLLVIGLTVIVSNIYSQRTISTVSAQLSFPQQEYKKSYPVTGVGLRWNVMHRPNANIPISIGGELGFLITSTDSKFIDLNYLGFFDRYRIRAASNIISLAFKARADLLPAGKPVQLFIDGTIGTNLFYSSVDIERQTFFGSQQVAGGSSTKGYWALIGGPGLGIEIPVGKAREIAISLKGSYLFGNETRYLTDPYVDNGGNVYFTERESRTDMLLLEAGIRFAILTGQNRR